jgi:type I restriction enzyme M protein
MLIALKRDNKGHIWSYIRKRWLVETPEEAVRQQYLLTLVNEYGYALEQIAEEESVTGRGAAQARADFLVWRTIKDRADDRPAFIVVECKSDNVTIDAKDYAQGENYARREGAPFFVTHNNRETRYWRVLTDRRPGYLEEIENIPHADASDQEVEQLIKKLKTFKEDEFAALLHKCHNVIRNREHLDPAAAFDEIAKVLFIKTWVEREMKRKRQSQNLFTAAWLDTQLGDDPLQTLFQQTRDAYADEGIFGEGERLRLKPATGREIVRLLERYNLSDTTEDVKGIAFERFLGRTFRGEIGQFFTPRVIVEFMVRMVEPREGDVVCDPASGSGGFLIRFFNIVREQILADADREYREYASKLDGLSLSAEDRAERLRQKYEEIQVSLDQQREGSRLWKLANRCIYGTDANDRMARTSKMNMIMHGDGHGGVHHHNGFINVNGIFEGRFDVILTNPPFGANVEPSDRVTLTDAHVSDSQRRRYEDAYGNRYREAQARVEAAAQAKAPIASLFDLPYRSNSAGPRPKPGKTKTEVLFIERCLELLKPGGRLGIVLPEGVFNSPSLAYVREYCENRMRIEAVVSLPQEAFGASGASVKTSLLFARKLTDVERDAYADALKKAVVEVADERREEVQTERARLEQEVEKATNANAREAAKKALRAFERAEAAEQVAETRRRMKKAHDYPVFLYDAQHVGMTATGEPDACELFETGKKDQPLPSGIGPDDTALALYRAFRTDPTPFFLDGSGAVA